MTWLAFILGTAILWFVWLRVKWDRARPVQRVQLGEHGALFVRRMRHTAELWRGQAGRHPALSPEQCLQCAALFDGLADKVMVDEQR